jgi:hypothetical protein
MAWGKGDDDTDDIHCQKKRDTEAEDEAAPRDPSRHIGREPRPEEVARGSGAFGLGDDLDAGLLDTESLDVLNRGARRWRAHAGSMAQRAPQSTRRVRA